MSTLAGQFPCCAGGVTVSWIDAMGDDGFVREGLGPPSVRVG